MKNRVCALYRVSTDKQVDHNDKNQADIPMQRKACHAFCDKMGWTIVHEEQEGGVSGHKVRAENRDKLQIIKQLAKQKKFDILLVFMFDRIGRIADETPFVVEWFVKQGIEVWSTQKGSRTESADRLEMRFLWGGAPCNPLEEGEPLSLRLVKAFLAGSRYDYADGENRLTVQI